jgi:2'-5' RNA ligase
MPVADLIEGPLKKIGAHRVFVGVMIAPEIAQELAAMAKPLASESVRLVADSDIHLTLVPPWNETDTAGAAGKLREAVYGSGCFLLSFKSPRYGPTLRHPHLLWAECDVSHELIELRRSLLAAFGQLDRRPFRPHVTLARIPKGGRAIARKNPLDQTLSFSQHVASVELFESPPKGPGGYQVLASLPLGMNLSSTGLESDSPPRPD